MNDLQILLLGGVVLAVVLAAVICVVTLIRLREELDRRTAAEEAHFKNKVRHDLDIAAHFGEMIIGLATGDKARILEQLRRINVQREAQRFNLARHLAKEPPRRRLRSESPRAGVGARVHGT